jgi:periplasmic divalent cation tolerance protein
MEKALLYMTAPTLEVAQSIGKTLVEGRLIACANIIDNMRSIYVWEDRLQSDREFILIGKTVKNRVPEIIDTVVAMHPDDCPCILALPVDGGNPPFLEWIAAEVSQSESSA